MKNQTQSYNHRNPIGFKVTDNKLAVIDQLQSEPFTIMDDIRFEEIMRVKGLEQGYKWLLDFFGTKYGLLSPEAREEKLFNELREIKKRFFSPMK